MVQRLFLRLINAVEVSMVDHEVNNMILSEICVSVPGLHYCLYCEQFYCGNYKLLHERQQVSTNHQIQITSYAFFW